VTESRSDSLRALKTPHVLKGNMKGLHTAVALGTASLVGLAGAGVGVGWFLSASSCYQDQTSSRTKPLAPSLS
jgi:hypothetical protein